MKPELTADCLRIPCRVARRFLAKHPGLCRRAGKDLEELEGEAALALVQVHEKMTVEQYLDLAGRDRLAPYLTVACRNHLQDVVRAALAKMRAPEKGILSIDAPIAGTDDVELAAVIAAPAKPDEAGAAITAASSTLEQLTFVEKAIVRLQADGHPLREISRFLGISLKSLKRRINRIARRLGAPVVQQIQRRKRSNPTCGAVAPLGAIRVHTYGGRRVRRIKVAMDGPTAKRWKHLSHHWWEANRGPIPPGHCLIRKDGDSLNDDPDNLLLLPECEMLQFVVDLAKARDPERYCRQQRERNLAVNAMVRTAADVNTPIKLTRWYAVSHPERYVQGPFGNRQHTVYSQLMGKEIPAYYRGKMSNYQWISYLLGWSCLPSAAAAQLHGLAESRKPMNTLERRKATDTTLAIFAIAPLLDRLSIHRNITILHKHGMVRRVSHGVHEVTPHALAVRQPPLLVAAVAGKEAQRLLDQGYEFRRWLGKIRRDRNQAA